MELKSLILGLLFSVGVFAVKSGAGLSYQMARQGHAGKWLVATLYGATYGMLFWLVGKVMERVDFLHHLDSVSGLLKNGMTLHFLLAGLLLAWGFFLIQQGSRNRPSKGWLLLALPCPVCFTVILFSTGLVHALLPQFHWLILALGAGFISLGLFTAALLARMGHPAAQENNLGTIMVLAGLYFLLCLAIIPHFSEVERIYRLSQSSVSLLATPHLAWFLCAASLAFTIGLLQRLWRRASWT